MALPRVAFLYQTPDPHPGSHSRGVRNIPFLLANLNARFNKIIQFAEAKMHIGFLTDKIHFERSPHVVIQND